MKITRTRVEQPKFVPFDITIKFEERDELYDLFHRISMEHSDVYKDKKINVFPMPVEYDNMLDLQLFLEDKIWETLL